MCDHVCSQAEQQLDCALDLMRRLPPQQIEKNLSDLIDLVSCHRHLALFIRAIEQTHSNTQPLTETVYGDSWKNDEAALKLKWVS